MKWLAFLEQEIRGGLGRLRPADETDHQLVSIHRQMLDEICRRALVQPGGGVQFPYRSVEVLVLGETEERRAEIGAYWADENRLSQAVEEELRRIGAEYEKGLRAWVTAVEAMPEGSRGPMAIRCTGPGKAEAGKAGWTLRVTRGSAEPMAYRLGDGIVNIGREAEVTMRGGGMRQNQIAFDPHGPGATVSRLHAQVVGEGSGFRLQPLPGAAATYLLRGGRENEVGQAGASLAVGDRVRLGSCEVAVEDVAEQWEALDNMAMNTFGAVR